MFQKGLILMFLVIGNIYSQSDSNTEINWYNILYDEEGIIKEYIVSNTFYYNSPIIIKIFFNENDENKFVKCTIVDDKENICFEEVREVINNEILLKLSLFTTTEYLMNANNLKMMFKCKINIMNEYFFESEYIDVFFAYIINVVVNPWSHGYGGYELKSTDGSYEYELDIERDGVLIGELIQCSFINLLPQRNYTFILVSENGIYRNIWFEDKPFHELLYTIEDDNRFKMKRGY
jgi:hypothetical protein